MELTIQRFGDCLVFIFGVDKSSQIAARRYVLCDPLTLLAYFPQNESEAFEITSLSVCVPPPPQ
jgi:hypothetical protein